MVYLSLTLGRQDNMALTGTATTHTQVWLLRDLVPKFRALFRQCHLKLMSRLS